MAGRIRTIKPELLDDERAAALSDAAWRLFVSSWLLADDHGRFRAGARYLAAMVWQDTGRAAVAAEALAELVQAGRVRVYKVSGETYAEIPTWSRHQRIDNAGKPRIPPPVEGDSCDSEQLAPVPPRTAETRGDPPLGPPRVAALPPTSDQGNGPGDPPQPPPGGEPAKGGRAKGGRRRTPEHPMPGDWKPDQTVVDLAKSLGLDKAAFVAELGKFRDHAATHDRRCADWQGAARGWLRKAVEMRPEVARGPSSPTGGATPTTYTAAELRENMATSAGPRRPVGRVVPEEAPEPSPAAETGPRVNVAGLFGGGLRV